MDKLDLDLDDLEVDSFQTNPEKEDAPGTVNGNREKTPLDCPTAGNCDGIDDSIWGTCETIYADDCVVPLTENGCPTENNCPTEDCGIGIETQQAGCGTVA